MRKVNYGIVGVGYFGSALARALAKLDHAEIVAVYDPENGAEVAADLQCINAETLDQLVSIPEVDTVVVATPNGYHLEAVVKAASNKKNVFCEKPLTLSLADVDEMIETCKKNEVIFMAGHIMYFMNGVRKVKELLSQGVIGDILTIHAERTGWEDASPKVSWKKMQHISGGHVFHHIHELDFIQSLLGPATSVYTAGGNLCHSGEGFGTEDDVALLTLTFEGNKFATMQYGSAFHMGQHFVRISGTKGAMELNMQDVALTVKTREGVQKYLVGYSSEEDQDRTNLYKYADGGIAYGNASIKPPLWLATMIDKETAYLHQIMQGGEIDQEFLPLFNGTAARESIKTAESAIESLRKGELVIIK